MRKSVSANPRQFRHGLFIVSLDFELYWGVRDKRTLESYKSNLQQTPEAIDGILNLFRRYNIHATWATVGALFLTSRDEFLQTGQARPGYTDSNLCPYAYATRETQLEARYHFTPDIVERIKAQPGQEIATHTFSHFYCAEDGVSPQALQQDLSECVRVAAASNQELKSIVFPRNQVEDSFLPVVSAAGLTSYRGNPNHWAYRSVNEAELSLPRRALRFIDSYINITGNHLFRPDECLSDKLPINIPASAFLRPYSQKLAPLEPLKLHRIKKSLSEAALNRTGYHLWWHPHNFGANLRQNLMNLESILDDFANLREKLGIQSVNMREATEGLLKGALLEKP